MKAQSMIWDPLVRFFHWTVAASFLLNFLIFEEGETNHRWAGYYILAALAIRILWGFIGSKNARFKDFLPTSSGIKQHLNLLISGRFEVSEGHTPLGGLMVFALLFCLLSTGLSGWMTELDVFWVGDWLEEIHEFLASTTMTLVVIHVSAVFLLSKFGPVNLIKQMITGQRDNCSK
ncbi:cytochrome B561 [Psychromonas ingrahamii 37]|uniref:Cytochrome B561 n=1 Tax=Psychromonas ingrahamii (strain DSM 17664 / CCUG 51855 / 37) TaxID=357804 RepID=A1SU92_PSYIN|nr:cytochrome b/b6 domain-containing protein [Psychromonas ingrahamii]ABM03057.1 cytochrome B561 [Psychromonas ingrahamii 37]